MTVFNLGSINIDRFYSVPHLPSAGETLAATAHWSGLGGKGANQSLAAARGGARVVHIGAIGPDGDAVLACLGDAGVNIENVTRLEEHTGHAIISVDSTGENAIVIFSSANLKLTETQVSTALGAAKSGDFCLLQNETNLVSFAAELARNKGLSVVYSAAPFNCDRVKEVLSFIDLLVVNEVEADQLAAALGVTTANLPVAAVLVTRGAAGATYRMGGEEIEVSAFAADPVDTTGAGDTYLGFLVAGFDARMDVRGAMKFASAAAAIQVGRQGTASAIPTLTEVRDFLKLRLTG